MEERIKILPAVVLTGALLLGVKLFGLVTGGNHGISPIEPAIAGSTSNTGHAPAPAKGEADIQTHPNPPSLTDGAGAETVKPRPSLPPSSSNYLSQSEVQVLEALTKRREDLDVRLQEVELKEKLLVATEQRVQEKIAELKEIEAQIESLLGARDAAEEEQMQRLVKVYENMKSKDAARIFQNLDRGILLNVASRMKEARVATILAEMDPRIAQDLTVMLATRLKLPDEDK